MTKTLTTTNQTKNTPATNNKLVNNALAKPTNEDNLNTAMWLKTFALSDEHVGSVARVAGLPTVLKVKCWNGQRFAWIAIGEMIVLKVWEGSVLSNALHIGWRKQFKNPVKTRSIPVVVEGTIHKLSDGTLTMHHAKVVGKMNKESKVMAWVMGSALEVQYAAATGNDGFLNGYLATEDADLIPLAEKLQNKILSNAAKATKQSNLPSK